MNVKRKELGALSFNLFEMKSPHLLGGVSNGTRKVGHENRMKTHYPELFIRCQVPDRNKVIFGPKRDSQCN